MLEFVTFLISRILWLIALFVTMWQPLPIAAIIIVSEAVERNDVWQGRGVDMAVVVYIKLDLMLRNRCKIEMNTAQLRFRYINLAHKHNKSVQRGRVS